MVKQLVSPLLIINKLTNLLLLHSSLHSFILFVNYTAWYNNNKEYYCTKTFLIYDYIHIFITFEVSIVDSRIFLFVFRQCCQYMYAHTYTHIHMDHSNYLLFNLDTIFIILPRFIYLFIHSFSILFYSLWVQQTNMFTTTLLFVWIHQIR